MPGLSAISWCVERQTKVIGERLDDDAIGVRAAGQRRCPDALLQSGWDPQEHDTAVAGTRSAPTAGLEPLVEAVGEDLADHVVERAVPAGDLGCEAPLERGGHAHENGRRLANGQSDSTIAEGRSDVVATP